MGDVTAYIAQFTEMFVQFINMIKTFLDELGMNK